jgi:hypothetical protein
MRQTEMRLQAQHLIETGEMPSHEALTAAMREVTCNQQIIAASAGVDAPAKARVRVTKFKRRKKREGI